MNSCRTVRYAPFLDDRVARSVAPTRHNLRKAIKVDNRTLAEVKVEKTSGNVSPWRAGGIPLPGGLRRRHMGA